MGRAEGRVFERDVQGDLGVGSGLGTATLLRVTARMPPKNMSKMSWTDPAPKGLPPAPTSEPKRS